MAQLWVNLPAKHKMSAPRYQTILSGQIPDAALPDDAGGLRVIAGLHAGRAGPATTFSALNVWDVRLHPGRSASLPIPEGYNAAIAVLKGSVVVGSQSAQHTDLLVFDRAGDALHIEAGGEGAVFLVLSGQPIAEPIVGYGPFVMNTREEIEVAMNDYRSGKFGRMPPDLAPALSTAVDA